MKTTAKALAVLAATLTGGVAAADDFTKKYPDFACEVDTGPISDAEEITNEYLMDLGKKPNGQEMIDRIYARSTAGAMPKGFYRGRIIPAKSEQNELLKKFLTMAGLPTQLQNDGTLKFLGEWFWKGKVFKDDPLGVDNAPTRILANKMPITNVKMLFKLFGLEAPEGVGTNQWRFPAKVFCGVSLFDARRESVIIDYAHTESVDDDDANEDTKIEYHKPIDFLAGRKMLQIRDEIRMVRPGFYLGRAYMGRVFVLNFTLECQDDQCRNEQAEDCMIGGQRETASNQKCMSMQQFRTY